MVPPDLAFHSQTLATKASRPMSRRPMLPAAASWRSTTIWVAMPAWSVPGSHSAALPRMRSKRISMSCSVLFSAWPMCSEPVTFGGGMTIENGSAAGSSVGAKAPEASHCGVEARFGGFGIEGLFKHGGSAAVHTSPLVPAKAGTQAYLQCERRALSVRPERRWVPACAGMSGL